MYDATWQLIDAAFDVAGVLLDADPDAGEVTLEPSCFAWALRCADEDGEDEDENAKTKNQKPKAGGNFSLPHRDYPASEAWNTEADAPRLVSAWIPLTDATTDNGCMYVLPAATRFVLVGFQTPRPSHPRAARGGRRRDAPVRRVAREADDRQGWVGVRVGGADGALGGRVRPA
jgi:hypothetical protein